MAFWSDTSVTVPAPKRNFRWLLYLGGVPSWLCKKVTKPAYSITETVHEYLNHKFYYPGRVEWSEVSVSFVDTVGADGAADIFLEMLKDAGYTVPTAADAQSSNLHTLGKDSMHTQLGDVYLYMVNAEGVLHEKWTLRNAFFKSVRLSGLDYGSDEMLTVDTSIRYDYATYERSGEAADGTSSTLADTSLWAESESG